MSIQLSQPQEPPENSILHGEIQTQKGGEPEKKRKKKNNLTPLKVEVLDGERKDKPKK